MTIDATDAAAYAWPSQVNRANLRPTLAEIHTHYLAERGHTPSTAGLANGPVRWRKQALYVLGEALELGDAVLDLSASGADDLHLRAVRHEIADVALSLVTLAKDLGVTVESCIAEKTAADRGRG